jgi:hypothetical protein
MRVRSVVGAAVVAVLVLLVGACGDDDDDTAGDAPTTAGAGATVPATEAETSTVPTTATTTSTTADPDATTTTSTAATTTTVLGVPWLGEAAFADQPFGTGSLDAAVAIAAEELGEPTDDAVVDCDGGRSRQVGWDVLTLSGDPETDVVTGWSYRGGEPALMGPYGVGIGTRVDQLRFLLPGVEVFEASLGPEFTWTSPAGVPFGGFLREVGDGGGAGVLAFHAGFLCAFR